MRRWPSIAAAAALLLSVGLPQRATAHAIESSLERLQSLREDLVLESRFSNGEPVVGAGVRLVAPGGGTSVELGQIDAEGRLSFKLPDQADGTWELEVDGGPGHRDFLDLPVQGGRIQLDQVSETPLPARSPLASPAIGSVLLLGGIGSLGWLLAGLAGWRFRSRR